MSWQERVNHAVEKLADELDIPKDKPSKDAFWKGVEDGQLQGPEPTLGMTYEDSNIQASYDVGAWIGAAIYGAETSGFC